MLYENTCQIGYKRLEILYIEPVAPAESEIVFPIIFGIEFMTCQTKLEMGRKYILQSVFLVKTTFRF